MLVRQSTAQPGCCWQWDALLREGPGAALSCAGCSWHGNRAYWPQEEPFLGGWGLGSLASSWSVKFSILDSVFQSHSATPQVREAEGRKVKQVLAESRVMVPQELSFLTMDLNNCVPTFPYFYITSFICTPTCFPLQQPLLIPLFCRWTYPGSWSPIFCHHWEPCYLIPLESFYFFPRLVGSFLPFSLCFHIQPKCFSPSPHSLRKATAPCPTTVLPLSVYWSGLLSFSAKHLDSG